MRWAWASRRSPARSTPWRLGLVHRYPDPDDARARLIDLTDRGRDRIQETLAAVTQRWRSRLAQWDPVDIRAP